VKLSPKHFLFAAMGATALGVIIWGAMPQPAEVTLGKVAHRPLETWVEDDGFTRVRELYTVNAPVTGRVLRLPVERGDDVVAGDTVVATLLPADPAFLDERRESEAAATIAAAEAALAAARDETKRAEAALTLAEADYGRVEPLVKSGTYAPARLDTALQARDSARAAVAAARSAAKAREADVKAARAALIGPGAASKAAGVVDVRTPVSGKVMTLLHESSGVVTAGTPLLEIGDPNDLEIVVDYLSQKVVNLPPGTRAEVRNWGGDPFPARLRLIEPKGYTKYSALGVEEQRVDAVIDFDPADVPKVAGGLQHGYRVDVRLIVTSDANALTVPISALVRTSGSGWAVFRADGGRAHLQPVRIGAMNNLHAAVTDGLSDGDIVVLYPPEGLEDGHKVNARNGEIEP